MALKGVVNLVLRTAPEKVLPGMCVGVMFLSLGPRTTGPKASAVERSGMSLVSISEETSPGVGTGRTLLTIGARTTGQKVGAVQRGKTSVVQRRRR